VVRVATFAVGVAIGAILVVGVASLYFGPWWVPASSELIPPVPRLSEGGPVVRNGVAVIVACGKKQGIEKMGAALDYAPEPATGGWWPEKKGECTVYYHRPPDATQREARQGRS
jgi:hypothetical protein